MQTKTEKEKSRRLRFSYDDDVSMLREVVAQNPLANPERWEVVQINVERTVGKQFQIRTLKQHLQLLLEIFLKKDEILKIRSGEEEPYSERDALLLEISTLSNECGGSKKKRTSCTKEKKIRDLGREARERFSNIYANKDTEEANQSQQNSADCCIPVEVVASTNTILMESNELHEILSDNDYSMSQESTAIAKPIIPTSASTEKDEAHINLDINSVAKTLSNTTPETTPLGPIRQIRRRINKSRPLRRDAFSYLNEKSEKENWIRKKELELEERKIVIEEKRLQNEERKYLLEEKKFEIDTKERMQKLELERERLQIELCERKTLNNIMETQQKIIESLMK